MGHLHVYDVCGSSAFQKRCLLVLLMRSVGESVVPLILGFLVRPSVCLLYGHTHRIHGAGIYANIGGILMVNVTVYGIHGSYGIL